MTPALSNVSSGSRARRHAAHAARPPPAHSLGTRTPAPAVYCATLFCTNPCNPPPILVFLNTHTHTHIHTHTLHTRFCHSRVAVRTGSSAEGPEPLRSCHTSRTSARYLRGVRVRVCGCGWVLFACVWVCGCAGVRGIAKMVEKWSKVDSRRKGATTGGRAMWVCVTFVMATGTGWGRRRGGGCPHTTQTTHTQLTHAHARPPHPHLHNPQFGLVFTTPPTQFSLPRDCFLTGLVQLLPPPHHPAPPPAQRRLVAAGAHAAARVRGPQRPQPEGGDGQLGGGAWGEECGSECVYVCVCVLCVWCVRKKSAKTD